MRYRGLAGEIYSSWFWIVLLFVHGMSIACTAVLAYNFYQQSRNVEEEERCSSASVLGNLALAIIGPLFLYVMFYILTRARTRRAVVGATESSLRKGLSGFQTGRVPVTRNLKIFSVSTQNKLVQDFQSGEKMRREQLLEMVHEPPKASDAEHIEVIDAEHIEEIIQESDRLLRCLHYDGCNLLRLDPGRAVLFAVFNVLWSLLSLDLAYSTTEKCGIRYLFGQYLQFISVTTLLYVSLATFAEYGTFKSLIYHKLSQSDLEELSEVISLYVANTGRKIYGIRPNRNSSYADGDDNGRYDVYVPVISRHVVMRDLRVRGGGIVRQAHEDGEVMEGLYLIGDAGDDGRRAQPWSVQQHPDGLL